MSRPISTNMTNSMTSEARSRSASGEQVSVSMPTEVPCALMADGTVAAPSSWAVRNEGNVPARLSGVSASAAFEGLSFSATSAGAVLLKHSNGSASYDASLLVPSAGSLPITWSVSKVDPAAHPGLAADAARGPVELLSASFSFRSQAAAPAVSVTGQRVCMQTLSASPAALPAGAQVASAKWYAADSASGPWAEIAGADSASLPLGKDLIGKYVKCRLEYSGGDFDVPASESAACGPIAKAPATLSATISGEAKEGATLSAAVGGLPADSTAEVSVKWQMSDDGKSWTDFAAGETVVLGPDQVGKYVRCIVSAGDDAVYAVVGAPSGAVGQVKAKQAFAVYSADDNSLNFYKRFDVPAAGSTFEGKAATAVYTGIETAKYSFSEETGEFDQPWREYAEAIASASVVDEGISPKSTALWFALLRNMASCDVSKLDTSNVTDMDVMFSGCGSLTALDVSHFDTSKATSMDSMFADCSSLASLDVSGFDTSSVTDMSSMFNGCRSLATLDVSNWDTSSATRMEWMFYNCGSLTALDVSNWNTSNVASMYGMFSRCSSLTTLDVSHFNTTNVASMSRMFDGCGSLTTLDVSGFDTSKVTDVSWMFFGCGSLTSLDVSHFDTSKATSMDSMFFGCTKLQEVAFGEKWKWVGTDGLLPAPSPQYIDGADGLWHAKSDGAAYAPKDIPSGKADTYYAVMPAAFAVYSADDNSLDFYKRAEVPAVGSTFEGKTATAVYTGIETDVYTFTFDANFNMGSSAPWYGYSGKIDSVSIVDNDIAPSSTAYWFYKLNAMTACDIKKLDTSKISDMTNMFSGCKKLPSLDLSTWNTSKTTNMGGMFNDCWALASLDVSGFDTSNVTNMTSMFCYCSKLKSLDLSHFDTSQVTKMDSMFQGCSSLTALDLSHFDTSQVTDMGSMFLKCSELTTLDLSSFKTSDNVKMIYTFDNCEKLSKVKIGANFKWIGGSGHGYLPIPSSSYFTDADGKWYALSNGAGYVPSAIPSSKEDTYYASKALRDAAVGSGDEAGDADEIAPIPTQEQGVAARSLPAAGEDEASAAPSVEVSLELAGDGSRAAGPVAVTLSGDAGDAHAVLGKEGAKVALAPGRYLVSCLPAPEADGSVADAPAPFWIEASEGMEPVEIATGSASRRPAADVQARAAAIESWLAAAAGSVPQADAEALRSAAASALSACQAAEAVSEASDGSE